MSEPVTAADVIGDAIDTATNCFLSRKHLRDATADVVAALREACGGGDTVITASGALATLEAVEWEYGKPSEFRLVPVERGA